MKEVIIPQSQNGIGDISDIRSNHFSRVVIFEEDKFAFVKSAYYQDDDHQMFATLISAQMFALDSGFSGEIIEDDGSRYMKNASYIGKF